MSVNHYKFYQSTGFTASDSSTIHNISNDLTLEANNGTTMLGNSVAIYNYGNYSLDLSLSMDGVTFGDTQVLRSCQAENFYNAGIKKIKFNHTGNDTKYIMKALARSVSDIDFQPGCVNTRLRDKNGNMAEFDVNGCGDEDCGYLTTIEIEHHKIHKGDHFTCQIYDNEVDIGSPKYMLVRTPNTTERFHYTFNVRSSLNGTIYFFENPATSSTGIELTLYNNDRNSTSLSNLKICEDAVFASDGNDQLLVNVMGSDGLNANGSDGGVLSRSHEFILKQNTDYEIKFDTKSNNNRISICNEFYTV